MSFDGAKIRHTHFANRLHHRFMTCYEVVSDSRVLRVQFTKMVILGKDMSLLSQIQELCLYFEH